MEMAPGTAMSNKKFLFEQSFDDLKSLAVSDAKAEPKFSKADLEKAAADGHQAGLDAAMQTIEKHTMDLCGNILGLMQNLIGNYASDVDIISQKSLAVVLLSLKKLLPELYAAHGTEQIESIIQQCLAIAHEMPKIQIRVSPNMQSIIEQRIILIAQQHGFNGKLTVVADATLADSDCRVEWGNGGLENISSQCWQQMESLLSSAIPKSISGNMPHNNSEE